MSKYEALEYGMKWTDIKSRLDENPRSIPQPKATRYDDPVYNKRFAADKLARQTEVIEQRPDSRIIRTGDGHRGWIMLYNDAQQTADYVVQYATRRWPFLNSRTVTQVEIWRDPTSPFAAGVTKRMFFDYLLARYGAIMSDRVQTPQGHDFWQTRLRDAVQLGLHAGVVGLNEKQVRWFDPAAGQTLAQWLAATYGPKHHFEAIRYLITT
jgi:hypothetical protein